RTLLAGAHERASAMGKSVAFEAGGGEIVVDRAVAEALAGPLAQMVRNAVAHGIEAPRQRRLAGKPAIGLVSLVAREEGSAVRLTVTDDGAGIDRAMLAGRFRVQPAGPDEAGLPETIVRPRGPASEAADLFGGGGMGLDIVTKAAERLGGSVGLRSERGAGT